MSEKSKAKAVTVTLYPEQIEKAKMLSKKILGKSNISGLVAYLITKEIGNV